MKNINDLLRDKVILNSLYIIRLSKTEAKKILNLLNEAHTDLLAKLAKTEDVLTKSWLKDTIKNVEKIYDVMFINMDKTLRNDAEELATTQAKIIGGVLSKNIPISFNVTLPTANQLKSALYVNPLDRGTLYETFMKNLSNNTINKITAALRQSYFEGETIQQTIQKLRGTRANGYNGVYSSTRKNVEALARTFMIHASTIANSLTYKENDDIIKGEQFSATLDTSTCIECAELDGTVYDLDNAPKPPLHINCRCALVPVVKSWREIGIDKDELPPGTRASMSGYVSSTITYNNWLKGQSEDIQNDILGKAKATMFRNGLSLDDIVDRGRILTVKELRDKFN